MWYFTDGQVRHAAATHEHDGVLLKVVADARDVGGDFHVVGEADTRAIFRRAEFGFFGVIVRTIVQTPRFCGAPRWSSMWRPVSEFQVVRSAGVSTFFFCGLRPLRTSCEIVGTFTPLLVTRARTSAQTSTWRVPLVLPPTGEPARHGRGPRAQRGRSHKIATGPMREMTAPEGGHRLERQAE